MNTQRKHQILVLGAGYAGLITAQRLARRLHTDDVDITLVSATPDFVERPRLHQVATGQDVRTLSLVDLVARTSVRLRVAEVRGIHLDARQVTLQTGTVLSYETLVVALGSRIARGRVPGAAEHAVLLDSRGVADEAARRLATFAEDHGRVVVCGGGLTGLEIASEVADRWPELHVDLVSPRRPGDWLAPRAQTYLDSTLDALGVDRTLASVNAVEPCAVVLDGGERLSYDICLWAGGFEASTLVASSGLAVDATGRAQVDRTLRSSSHPDVWVVGDAAAVSGPWGEALAMGCRTGSFTAPVAADSIVAELVGGQPRTLRFRYWHECLSLGRRHGLVQFLDPFGRPRSAVLTGRPAITYKNVVLDSARVAFRHPGPLLAPRRHLRPASRTGSGTATIAP